MTANETHPDRARTRSIKGWDLWYVSAGIQCFLKVKPMSTESLCANEIHPTSEREYSMDNKHRRYCKMNCILTILLVLAVRKCVQRVEMNNLSLWRYQSSNVPHSV